MMKDKNGLDLNEGDIVIIPCRVVAYTGDGYREKEFTVETLEPAPSGNVAVFEVCGSQIIKGMQLPDLLKTRTHLPDSHHPLDIYKETGTVRAAGPGKVTETTDTSNLERFEREVSPNQTRSQSTFTELQDNARAENIQVGDIVTIKDRDATEYRVKTIPPESLPDGLIPQVVLSSLDDGPECLVPLGGVKKIIKNIEPDPVTKPDAANTPAPSFSVDKKDNEPPPPKPAVGPTEGKTTHPLNQPAVTPPAEPAKQPDPPAKPDHPPGKDKSSTPRPRR